MRFSDRRTRSVFLIRIPPTLWSFLQEITADSVEGVDRAALHADKLPVFPRPARPPSLEPQRMPAMAPAALPAFDACSHLRFALSAVFPCAISEVEDRRV